MSMNRYEAVIGLEIHTQLTTRSKIFSGAATAFGAEPNRQVSWIDAALPGTLPVLNREAVACAIRFGLAVGAKGVEGRLNRSAVPVNGPAVSTEAEMALLAQAKRITAPVVHEAAVPGGEPAPVGERGSSGSSEADSGDIATVALIVLAGVLLALPEILKALPEITNALPVQDWPIH